MFGFSSQWQNAGTIEGGSFELEARFQAVETNDFAWSVGLVAGPCSRAKITEFNAPCFTDEFQFRCAGEEIGTMRVPMWAENFDRTSPTRGSPAAPPGGPSTSTTTVCWWPWVRAIPGGTGGQGALGHPRCRWTAATYSWGMPSHPGFGMTRGLSGGNTQVGGERQRDLNLGISNTLRVGELQPSTGWWIPRSAGRSTIGDAKQRYEPGGGRSALFQDQHTKPRAEKKPLNYYVASALRREPTELLVGGGCRSHPPPGGCR